jgi:hypothetical protein
LLRRAAGATICWRRPVAARLRQRLALAAREVSVEWVTRARRLLPVAAAVVLGSLALVGLANRRIAPTGSVSFPGRPLGGGELLTWELAADDPLPTDAVVLGGAWAVRAVPTPTPPERATLRPLAAGGREQSGERTVDMDPWSSAGAAAEPLLPSQPRGMLCQVAGGPTGLLPLDFLLVDKRFPLLTLGEKVLEDLRVEAAFLLLRGNVDRAAGLAFRVRNQDEYYVVRANALEGNVNLYRFVDGRRSLIREAPAAVRDDVWHTLAVEARGSRIAWALDGYPLGEVDDLTFRRGGGLGLWTKADSVTCFDRIRAQAL